MFVFVFGGRHDFDFVRKLGGRTVPLVLMPVFVWVFFRKLVFPKRLFPSFVDGRVAAVARRSRTHAGGSHLRISRQGATFLLLWRDASSPTGVADGGLAPTMMARSNLVTSGVRESCGNLFIWGGTRRPVATFRSPASSTFLSFFFIGFVDWRWRVLLRRPVVWASRD